MQVGEQELELVKKKFGVVSQYMLFIGTLEPRKNILNLINAFYKFSQKNRDYSLVIIGKKGWFYESIFKLVEELHLERSVVFTGFVTTKEKFILLSGAHSFIYPSIYEGLVYQFWKLLLMVYLLSQVSYHHYLKSQEMQRFI